MKQSFFQNLKLYVSQNLAMGINNHIEFTQARADTLKLVLNSMKKAIRFNITPTNISRLVSHIHVHPDYFHRRRPRYELKFCYTHFNHRLASPGVKPPF